MAVSITTNGQHRHDQTADPQTDLVEYDNPAGPGTLTDDKDEFALSNNFSELPDAFEDFLILAFNDGIDLTVPDLSDPLVQNAILYDYAHETADTGEPNYFIDIGTDANEDIDDIFFSKSDGTYYNGETATYGSGTPMRVVGSTADIYLYTIGGGDILIATTQEVIDQAGTNGGLDINDLSTLDSSQLVFTYYLEENDTSGGQDLVGADLWGVSFQPLDHPDSPDNYDEAIDFGDFMNVTVSGSLDFTFLQLDSGNFLWVALGTESAGVIMTGRDLNVVDDETPDDPDEGDKISGGQDPTDEINTSQAAPGDLATAGVNNQHIDPGNISVFTFATGFSPLGSGPSVEGQNITEIDYGGYLNSQGGSLVVSQIQGNKKNLPDFSIRLYSAGDEPDGVDLDGDSITGEVGAIPETSFDYIGAEGGNDGTSGAFEDDTPVDVGTVYVLDENGDPVATWAWNEANQGSQTIATGITKESITVAINGNDIDIDDVPVLWTVGWTTKDGTFNRIQLEGDEGTWDVGKLSLDQGLTQTENIGADVLIHDDGPDVDVAADASVNPFTVLALNHDETIDPDGDNTPNENEDYYNTDSTPAETGSDGGTPNGDNDDQTGVLTVTISASPTAAQAIGKLVTTDGSAGEDIFNDVKVDYGTDGEGDLDTTDGRTDSLKFVLSDTTVGTNLVATAIDNGTVDLSTGWTDAERTISLRIVSGTNDRVVEGYFTDGTDTYVAFRMTLKDPTDLAKARIETEHFIPIDHDASEPVGSQSPETPSLYDEEITMSLDTGETLKIQLTSTVEDGDDDQDSDTATATIADQSGSFLSFDDDGPDVDVAADASVNPFTVLALNHDETIDPDGDDTPNENEDYYNTDSTPAETGSDGGTPNGDNDDQTGVLTVTISASPTAAEAIGKLVTTDGSAGEDIFNDVKVDYGTDGEGDLDTTDGRTDSLKFVLSDTTVGTNLVATAIDNGTVDLSTGWTDAERTISLRIVSGTNDRVVEGYFTDGTDTYVAFRMTLKDPTDLAKARIETEHFIPIDHDASEPVGSQSPETPSLYDEEITMSLDTGETLKIQLTSTVEDGDDDQDSDTATATIADQSGSFLSFDDDGPDVDVAADASVNPFTVLALNHDETIDPDGDDTPNENEDYYNTDSTPAETGSDGGTPNGDNDDQTGVLTVTISASPTAAEAIGKLVTTDGSAGEDIFNDVKVDYGTDGEGDLDTTDGRTDSLKFVLSDTTVGTNLVATAIDNGTVDLSTGWTDAERTISLRIVSGTNDRVVEGYFTDGTDTYVAFRMTLKDPTDLAKARIETEHFIPIDHDASEPVGSQSPETPSLYDEEITMSLDTGETLKIQLTSTVEDGDDDQDSDTATATIADQSGSFLSFDDDGPKAAIIEQDVDVVHDEDAGQQTGGTIVYGDPPENSIVLEDNDDNDQAGDPPASTGILALETADLLSRIGWAKSPSAVVLSEDTDGTTLDTDYGTDGPAASDAAVWSLDVSGEDADLLFTDLDGNKILLNVETVTVGSETVSLVVGRIDDDGDEFNDVDDTNPVALAIQIDQNGILYVAQYVPLYHYKPSDADSTETMDNDALIAVLTVTDGDDDVDVATLPIGDKVQIEDSYPIPSNPLTRTLEEDDIDVVGNHFPNDPADTEEDKDGSGDGSGNNEFNVVNLALLVSSEGADTPVTFAIRDLTDAEVTALLPKLYSQGQLVTYDRTGDKIEGKVGTTVIFDFEITYDATDGYQATFEIYEQLDHVPFGDNKEQSLLLSGDGTDTDGDGLPDASAVVTSIDMTPVIVATDADTDELALSDDLKYEIYDDRPIFTGDIQDGIVDFSTTTAATGADDFGGDSVASVSGSLFGKVGTDDNQTSDVAGDGTTLTYEIKATQTPTNAIPTLDAFQIDGETIQFKDDAGKLWFTMALDQDANTGAGKYTFTVENDPVADDLNFIFAGFPAGNQIYGVFAPTENPNDNGDALLVLPEGLDLKANGTLNNSTSKTLNSSKSDGSVTALAISNNTVDPGEAMIFASIYDPELNTIIVEDPKVDFDKGSYKDGDTLNFAYLEEFLEASMEIAQTTPNGSFVDFRIDAFDADPGAVGDLGTPDTDNVTFLEDPLATADGVDVVSVEMFDENGASLGVWTYDTTEPGDSAYSPGDVTPSNGEDVEFDIDDNGTTSTTDDDYVYAIVRNAGDNYEVDWTTATGADMWRLENVDAGDDGIIGNADDDGFDIAGFSYSADQPTPDQLFEFEVTITDFDMDQETSNKFQIVVDGTGDLYDDDTLTTI